MMMRLHKPHVVMTLLTALFSREKLYNPTDNQKAHYLPISQKQSPHKCLNNSEL